MKVAALDLGSNTTLMLIAEVQNGQVTEVYQDELRVTRMGQGVHANREFHVDALARVEAAFKDYKVLIDQEKPEKILALATSAARDVKNKEALLNLAAKYDIPIEIIHGNMEAELTFRGACSNLKSSKKTAVIDVGGGSTEVVFENQNSTVTGHSLDVGSVRLTELHVTGHPIPAAEVIEIANYVQNKANQVQWDPAAQSIESLIWVAGTPTTLAAVLQEIEYSKEAIDGYEMTLDQLIAVRDRLAAMDLETRKSLKGMDPLRADVIVTGATILIETSKLFKAQKIQVSDRGVRYGIALKLGNE